MKPILHLLRSLRSAARMRLEVDHAAVFRAWVGSGLLLAYLLATPLAPALTALLASMDRSHHIAIQQTAHGIQVVLRHDCLNSPAHRHGLAARVLTFFAQRTTPAQPDHVLQFTLLDAVQESSKAAVEADSCASVIEAFPLLEVSTRSFLLKLISIVFSRPSPAVSGSLLGLRSTVLLL